MRQAQALQIMMAGTSVFLTGAPGAGKTYVLNEFIRIAKKRGKNVAVTASTGIAATHIGGTTIHSWSGLGIQDSVSAHDLDRLNGNSNLVKRYNATDVLVIDEVSMLHGSRLDMVNVVAKRLRQSDKPFGGIQIVLVGDLYQLPPITRGSSRADFVHLSSAWGELHPTICYLTEQHRVTAGDALLDLLSAMRRGEVNEFHDMTLQDRLAQKPPSDATITRLYSHNIDVDAINDRHLASIEDEAMKFVMFGSGASAKREQLMKSVLAPEHLVLKRGAEVMFVANNFPAGYVNGTRGTVVDFANDTPIVVTAGGREVRVEPHSWKIEEDGKVKAEVSQLPLRLAWAITIHKSQGMSLDAAEIDLSRSFTPGMGYVALSRVRSLEGVYLAGINRMALAMHPLIHEFDDELRIASEDVAVTTEDFTDLYEADEVQAALDEALLADLKIWRTVEATRQHIPAYMVAHDSMLQELASRRPQTPQALRGIKGMGNSKFEKYSTDLLDILSSNEA